MLFYPKKVLRNYYRHAIAVIYECINAKKKPIANQSKTKSDVFMLICNAMSVMLK